MPKFVLPLMYFFLFVVKMIHFSCAIEKEVEPIQKEISVSDTYFPDLYALQLPKPKSLQKNTQFWWVLQYPKSYFTWRQNQSFKHEAEVFFETFSLYKETWKLPLYPVARKNTQAQLFFHFAHISQRPHILRILLKMLTCYFKNVGCAYFFADHINGLWRNVSEVQCTFFQFDRNYAWR